MKLNKRALENYTEKQVLEGISHQDIYNEVVSTSDYKIHDIASVIRKVPDLEKRKKYQGTNYALLGIMGLNIVSLMIAGTLWEQRAGGVPMILIGILLPILLFYGVFKFKRNAHLITALTGIPAAIYSVVQLIAHFDGESAFVLFTCCMESYLAWYLDKKLCSDYVYHEDKMENKTEAITFIS